MKRCAGIFFIFIWLLGFGVVVPSADTKAVDIETILKGMEARYSGKGFSVAFFQESMLKAMQISDTAEGRLTVKKPGKMRWEYTLPNPQSIITDGKSMWIYRPDDNQVMVGAAPAFFGDGKGASFLSDIRQVRKSFRIKPQPDDTKGSYRLKLIPIEPTPDIAEILLSVGKKTFQVDQVITFNAYGDETKITLNNYQFNLDPKDELFSFEIPEGIDVVELNQP